MRHTAVEDLNSASLICPKKTLLESDMLAFHMGKALWDSDHEITWELISLAKPQLPVNVNHLLVAMIMDFF